jgi:hypothetical protein
MPTHEQAVETDRSSLLIGALKDKMSARPALKLLQQLPHTHNQNEFPVLPTLKRGDSHSSPSSVMVCCSTARRCVGGMGDVAGKSSLLHALHLFYLTRTYTRCSCRCSCLLELILDHPHSKWNMPAWSARFSHLYILVPLHHPSYFFFIPTTHVRDPHVTHSSSPSSFSHRRLSSHLPLFLSIVPCRR